ncbi:protein MHF2 homolog [Impatiens glandulifera]|uniref:protein MHF2 homolog n=1 Tax=Impatiens glandulifera TaxID=253017 RepID=UPI001FB0A2F6|nr:protein MHF2 homolog [Impatiens glandulifera]
METTFEPDLINAIFKIIWKRNALKREKNEGAGTSEADMAVGMLKKTRPTSANANALKLSCELMHIFVSEAVQRASTIAETEGASKIEATHLERILPQLLLDF